jgi:glucose-6-phosphate isomerase
MTRYTETGWRDSMRVQLDYNNMMADFLGEKGISPADLDALIPRLREALQELSRKRERGETAWRDLPFNQETVVKKIEKIAQEIRDSFDTFVVFGIGGSALGPIAVQQALNHPHYNELPDEVRRGPRMYVVDNIDPEKMQALWDVVDPETTCFNVITKSGSTSETMAQFLIVADLLKERVGEGWQEHIVATTDAEKGNLIKIARQEGFTTLVVPDGVGGRFSELCPVGLLPAAVCGIDIREMLAGAAYMDAFCSEPDPAKNPAAVGAALQNIAMQTGHNISVMMPYADSLKYIAAWYAQLWAESLGKKYDLAGGVVNVGQTPVSALGVTDQHSQVQLYTEGPYDKVVTFLTVDTYRDKSDIPRGYEDIPAVSFLGGHTLNALIKAEQAATEYALTKAGRLNRTIRIPEVNAFTIGQLLYLLEVETAVAGELLRINTYDQPGVEEGKNATYALMGRPGYEEKKKELDSRPAKKEQYIL